MQPGDRMIVAFTEPRVIGEQFMKWFLHITIVPWFRLDEPSENIATGLEKALGAIKQFEVKAADEILLGPRRRRARLLENSSLDIIENKVRNYLHKKRAWLIDETTKKHYDFRPHVTEQGDQRLAEGETVLIDRLYIVEQKGDYKEVVAEIKLTGVSS